MTSDWEPRLAALTAALAKEGHLRSTEWAEAFAATPRHLFTPEVIITTPQGYRLPSTMPSLMVRMLEALGIEDGMRILEVGTGTGYNAALLSHRLGEDNVASIDIDPCLIDQAAQRIAQLGYTPTLLVGDGAAGAAEHGPYDRIIATAAVPEIPIAWVQQLTPGGKILANLRGDLAGGTLCLLSKEDDDDEVIGPILPLGGHFMWLRPDIDDPHRPHEHPPVLQRGTTSRVTTTLDPAEVPVDDDGFRFLLQLQLHAAQTLWRGQAFDPVTRSERDAVIATAADGSRAEACTGQEDDGSHRVVQTGPRRIWDTIEATFRLWRDVGQPAPEKFGLVANDSTQFAWFGDDDSWHRWPLPLV